MPDRSIPFFNIILRCDQYHHKAISLPKGFSIVPYIPGYESAWARLEAAIGDFDSVEDAERYFTATYLSYPEQLRKRARFLLNEEQNVIGSCLAWWDRRENAQVASLHWVVVDKDYRGLGLGRALCQDAMAFYASQGELPVYIHTQPWSWKAILLYLSLGFQLQTTDTFSHYQNEYRKAMSVLQSILPADTFQRLLNGTDSSALSEFP